MTYGADMVVYLFTSVPDAIFFLVLVCFPPTMAGASVSITCYTLKHCSVTESGFLSPGALYCIGLVSILGIEPLPQILPILSGASMGNF